MTAPAQAATQSAAVEQKVVVVQQQTAAPEAPQQIINVNVGVEVVNSVEVRNEVTIVQGGAQQTAVSGTERSDIVFAAVNNATIAGGAGDDILVAGATRVYLADLQAVNGSGVSGTALLVQDEDTLTVRIDARGLEPAQIHVQDINGRFAGDGFVDAGNPLADVPGSAEPVPINSVRPPPAADTDGDGFIEFAEGTPYYGPGIMGLTSPQGALATGFPVANANGIVSFMQAYDISGEIDPVGFTREDLLPLDLRTIVLYGDTVGVAGAGTPGEVNGVAGYKAFLPAAVGEIEFLQATARVESTATVNATLNGGAGEDILLGKSGNDILLGGLGDDWLTGNGGRNRLDGGDGADVFVLGAGQDTIEDFDFTEGDRLLVAGPQASINEVIESASSAPTGTRITTDDGGEVTLVGVAAGHVTTDWFTAV
jgi:Ca2+-binding RTX toxin-like protein